MPWVRVDDHFPDHVKLAELGDLAPLGGWLYLCALAWCNRQLTDGRIPKAQVHRLASFRHVAVAGTQVDAEAIALELVRVGLWDQYGGSMPSGWIRWLLEQMEVPFTVVYPGRLDAGDLKKDYDVLIFPDGGIPAPQGGVAMGAFGRQPAADEIRSGVSTRSPGSCRRT